MNDHALELQRSYPLNDPRDLCTALGLGVERKDRLHQAAGWTVRCPVHGGVSCSVTRAADGLVRVKCFGCDFSGNALHLVAAARGLSTRTGFKDVLREAAEIANRYDLIEELESGEKRERPAPPPLPVKAPEPERTYPPIVEVSALLASCVLPSEDAEVAAWLQSRGIDPQATDGAEVAYALPPDAIVPSWARYQRKPWTETGHRLIFPVYDADGVLRSVRAGRVIESDTPKRLPPGGHKASGLVLACSLAIATLCGTFVAARVVISEGEPDFLSWATKTGIEAFARFGILSGSWNDAFADKIQDGALVVVRTDNDLAGDKYAELIIKSLRGRCDVRRKKS